METTNLPTQWQLADLKELDAQFDESTLTFDEARRLLHAARPQKQAFGWRLEKLRRWGLAGELPGNASMEDLVYFFNEVKHEPATRKQINAVKELGFTVRRATEITALRLDGFLNLQGQPPRVEDLAILAGWGLPPSEGDALATYAMRLLVGYFVDVAGLALKHYEAYAFSDAEKIAAVRGRITPACRLALCDPEYEKPTITVNDYGDVIFSWPKNKVREWYRHGASF